MNKVTLALAAATAGLTLLSLHLWRQLDAERSRSQIAVTQRVELQTRVAKLEREPQPSPAPNRAAPAVPESATQPAPDAKQPPAAESDDARMALYNVREQRRWREARRRMLEDPHERELLKAQARNEARAENLDLARELQLTAAEYDQLIELLAENDLQRTDLFSRSDGNVSPDTMSAVHALREQLTRDIADLLGYEKAQQYSAFEDSRQVRTQVRRLRGRLSEDDVLSDEQNQRLVAALQKQRLSFNEEMQRRIPKERITATRGTWDGGSFIADSASKLPIEEQWMKQSEEFRKGQRQSASEVLSARQLRVFTQMQDEMLTEERLEARTRALVEDND